MKLILSISISYHVITFSFVLNFSNAFANLIFKFTEIFSSFIILKIKEIRCTKSRADEEYYYSHETRERNEKYFLSTSLIELFLTIWPSFNIMKLFIFHNQLSQYLQLRPMINDQFFNK